MPATIVGTSGDDVLVGTSGADVIVALGGNDTITGLGGDDTICGNGGDDTIFGHGGADYINAASGNDEVFGGVADDMILGGAGADKLRGNAGEDTLLGGADDDDLAGGADNDLLYGNAGADAIYGNWGDDTLYGGADDDRMYGGVGDDELRGNVGNDLLSGGTGTDAVYGNWGDDTLVGGLGNDLLNGGVGNDTVDGLVDGTGLLPNPTDDVAVDIAIGSPATVDALSNDRIDPTFSNSATVLFVEPGTATLVSELAVSSEGVWSTDSGQVVFTPEVGFFVNPTPVEYVVEYSQEQLTDTALITITYAEGPAPIANDDLSGGFVYGETAVHPIGIADNDNSNGPAWSDLTQEQREALFESYAIVGSDNNGELYVPGEGTWSTNAGGPVATSFTPDPGFEDSPTPVGYTFVNSYGIESNVAMITFVYGPYPGLELEYIDGLIPGEEVTVDIFENEDPTLTFDPTTVTIFTDYSNPEGSKAVTVDGEGTWTVHPTSGHITFTPEPDFTGLTNIRYQVEDGNGTTYWQTIILLNYNGEPLAPIANDDLAGGFVYGETASHQYMSDNDNFNTDYFSLTQEEREAEFNSYAFVGADENGEVYVPGEGTWSMQLDGGQWPSFTPDPGFADSPTPIGYTMVNAYGIESNVATITLIYGPYPGLELEYIDGLIPGEEVTVDIFENEDPTLTFDPTTVTIFTDYSNPEGSKAVTVDGEGTWTVHPTSGHITFTPEPDFTGLTNIRYQVEDGNGTPYWQTIILLNYNG